MEKETTTCPYCGEEILATAKKCKHCGEWINQEQSQVSQEPQTTIPCPFCGEEVLVTDKQCKHCGESLSNWTDNNDRIAKADVDDSWKERFKAIDNIVVDGKWWKYQPDFFKMPIKDRYIYTFKIYGNIGSFLTTLVLGGFYYLFKGMWVKLLIYLILSLCTGGILWILYPILAPYDYYRLKVLGKQW